MKKLILASSIAALSLASVPATAKEGQVFINPALGYMIFDSARDLESAPLFSLGLEYHITDNIGVEVTGLKGSADREDYKTNPGADVTAYRLDGLYYFNQADKILPYVAAGYSKLDLGFDNTRVGDYDESQFNFGGGARYLISDVVSLRGDLRALLGESKQDDYIDLLLTLGVSFAFGGKTPAPAPMPEPEPAPVAPLDSDGDGIPDNLDRCNGTPAGAPVDVNTGCPLDSDGDGIPDYKDQCSDTKASARVDENGCELVKVRLETRRLNVQFALNSARVKPAAMDDIAQLAEFMKQQTDSVVDIEGHSDSTGKASYNRMLSQKRADAVAKILVEQFGIEPRRVNAVGYGEERPIADNKTRKGRALNRRVVAVIDQEVSQSQ